jgi:hypothetical protein
VVITEVQHDRATRGPMSPSEAPVLLRVGLLKDQNLLSVRHPSSVEDPRIDSVATQEPDRVVGTETNARNSPVVDEGEPGCAKGHRTRNAW